MNKAKRERKWEEWRKKLIIDINSHNCYFVDVRLFDGAGFWWYWIWYPTIYCMLLSLPLFGSCSTFCMNSSKLYRLLICAIESSESNMVSNKAVESIRKLNGFLVFVQIFAVERNSICEMNFLSHCKMILTLGKFGYMNKGKWPKQ